MIYVTEELPVSSTNLCRSLVKSGYQKNNFLISLQKTYVVGTQNETVLLTPKTYAKIHGQENIYNITLKILFI